MFHLYRDFNDYFVGEPDPDEVRRLNPGVKTFRE